jgi:hypothetical protein
MQTFTYSVTDLVNYRSQNLEVSLERKEEALEFLAHLARELLDRMPDLDGKGMCVAVSDSRGHLISIVPLDPIQ